MTKMKMLVLAALVGSVTAASASPQITYVGCKYDAGKLDASVGFRDPASGAIYNYKATVDRTSTGAFASTILRDAAGRTLVSARASSSSQPQTTYGAGWTRRLGDMLVEAIGDEHVQAELANCAQECPTDVYFPWCPVIIEFPDPVLEALLCGFVSNPLPMP